MKIFTIILGVLVLIGGIVCLFVPGATFGSLSIIIGIIVAVAGIAIIVNYFMNRKLKTVTGWDLAVGILTLLLGILLVFNNFANHVLDVILVYMFAIGILVIGVVRAVLAVRLRGVAGGKMWIWSLIFAILIAILGIYFLFNPMIAGLTIGFMLAFFVILSGIDLIAAGISMKKGT